MTVIFFDLSCGLTALESTILWIVVMSASPFQESSGAVGDRVD